MDTTDVRAKHKFDEVSLDRYLADQVSEYPKSTSDLVVKQFSNGQSNPTFYLKKDGKEFVMRKKPPGRLLKGAHQIEREYRVQSALYKAKFPVPRMVHLCQDASVIGQEFYIMEHVKGRIFRDLTLQELPELERKAYYYAMMFTLTKLHRLNFRRIGLENYGKVGDYRQRQINTWTKQYRGATKQGGLEEMPAMEELIDWLNANNPKEREMTTIVHGDFRMDNMIFHPTKARVIAVLDWELSTLGDPITDVTAALMLYHWPADLPSPFGDAEVFATLPGIPSEETLLKLYSQYAGSPYPLPNWEFYKILSFFKLAAISQGIRGRVVVGNASSAENAEVHGYITGGIADAGLNLVRRSNKVAISAMPAGASEIIPVLSSQPLSEKARDTLQKVKEFVNNEVLPNERVYLSQLDAAPTPWYNPPIMEELKEKARKMGLWNLFLPAESGFTQLEYAYMAEEMGRSPLAPEAFNCNAPDTGNMEVLHLYGSKTQQEKWLKPLLEGTMRSCFSMTEPQVASSDATNMECTITRDGDSYVVDGRKWWSSGAGNPKCKFAIVMGRTGDTTTPRHKQHSMIIVPMETPGVNKIRALHAFGHLDAPYGHFEIEFENVRVPAENLILGEGKGFEIAQGRLGPGRIHHCMRLIGLAERSLELACQRAVSRRAFHKHLAEMGVVQHQIAESRIAIEQARLLTLKAAHLIDLHGTKRARKEVAMIKVVAPRMACQVIDQAIQIHGGAGVSNDFPLAAFYGIARCLRIADGPDEVHLMAVALRELKSQMDKAKL